MLVPLKHDRITSFCDSIDELGPVLYPRLRRAADTSEASYRDFCSHAGSGSWGRMYWTVYCSCLRHCQLIALVYRQYSGIQCTYSVQGLYSVVKCWVFRATRVSCAKMFLFLFYWWGMLKVKVKPKLIKYTLNYCFFVIFSLLIFPWLLTTPT